MRTSRLVLLVLFRIFNALFVRTYFNPDEFWQSLEIAHRLVFKYGFLTWEWHPPAQIRGFAHPFIFTIFYKLLEITNCDTRWMVAYGPRILQGVFAAMTDIAMYLMSRRYFDEATALWGLFCHVTSWFNFYCLVRPLSTSLETLFTTLALLYWPWPLKRRRDTRFKALCFAAMAIVIRPTSAVLWIFLGLHHLLFHCQDRVQLIFAYVIPIGTIALTLMMYFDCLGYGEWVFVPLNFFRFNVVEGKSHLYGTHPWHWYFSNGLPAIIGTMLPVAALGVYASGRAKLVPFYASVLVTGIYSFSAHKEFRFVLPLLPIALMYAGHGLRCLQLGFFPTYQKTIVKYTVLFLIVTNLNVAVYLSRYHQRAPLDVMDYLADQIDHNSSVHFLTSCHATPYYSHLHSNIPLWFPDCAPSNRILKGGSESDQLRKNPLAFVQKKYARDAYPTFYVMFADTATKVESELKDYIMVKRFYHAQFSGDSDDRHIHEEMVVFKQAKKMKQVSYSTPSSRKG